MMQFSSVHPNARIAANVEIGPYCYIAENVEIGEGCVIGPHVTIFDYVKIGKNCKIFPGAVIGAIPQDMKYSGEVTWVEIGNNTVIRECATVNRGTAASGKMLTKIGDNCLIMSYLPYRQSRNPGQLCGTGRRDGCGRLGYHRRRLAGPSVHPHRYACHDPGRFQDSKGCSALYHCRRCPRKNYKKAFFWMKMAGEQNHPKAQYYLGLLYLNGEGVTLDYNQAYNWFRRSAEQGYVPSIYYVGKCYLEGYGVTKDRGSAMDYFQRAANSGNSSAKAELMLLRSE